MAKKTFEDIKPWDGTSDTGAQARQKISRNFGKVNDAIGELEDSIGTIHAGLPLGGIIMWSGSVVNIPPGFHLCDGTTVAGFGAVPDLQSKFIVGYDPTKPATPTEVTNTTENYGAIGNKGGKLSVKLTAAESGLPAHEHAINGSSRYSGYAGIQYGADQDAQGTEVIGGAKAAEQAHENRPPYYVLAFLIKVAGDGTGGSAYQSYLNTTTDEPVKTEEEWVLSLSGDGISAYAIAVDNGFVGTEEEWLASLIGQDGYTPQKGTDYFDGEDGDDGRGISSIVRTSGNGAAGTTDTYTVTFTDTSTTTFTVVNGANGTTTETIGYALSDQTSDITTGVKITDRMPYAFTLTSILGSLAVAATGGTFTVNIKKNGVSIFTTKLTFDSGESTTATAAVPYVLSTTTFAANDIIELSVDTIGSVTAGKGLIIKLIGTK